MYQRDCVFKQTYMFVCMESQEAAALQLAYGVPFVLMSAQTPTSRAKVRSPLRQQQLPLTSPPPPLHFPCWKFWFEECNLETFSLLPVPGWQGSYFRLDILHPHSPWQFLTSVNCESCKLAGLIPGQVQAAFVTISSICQGREAGNEGCIY